MLCTGYDAVRLQFVFAEDMLQDGRLGIESYFGGYQQMYIHSHCKHDHFVMGFDP